MKLNEVLESEEKPKFLKTLDQETTERQYQIFMDDNIAKIANELDRQIKAGNVTATPKVNPTVQPQAQVQPVSQPAVQSQAPTQSIVKAPPHVKTAQQTLDKQGGQFSKLPTVAAQAATTRQQKQAQAADVARAGMTNKPPIKPAVWRSNRTESVRFEKLNSLFESIINIDEAVAPMHISDYIVVLFRNTMNNPIFKDDPAISAELQKLAEQVEKTYSVDKGRAAISELVKFGYAKLAEYHTNRKLSRSSVITKPPVTTPAPASTFGINPDGSITVSGAKGQDAGKVLPGDPLYPKFVAYINKELSK